MPNPAERSRAHRARNDRRLILQALLAGPAAQLTLPQLCGAVWRPRPVVETVIAELISRGWVTTPPAPDGRRPRYTLTPYGRVDALLDLNPAPAAGPRHELGLLLRGLRLMGDAGTQTQLADTLGVHHSVLARIEGGSSEARLRRPVLHAWLDATRADAGSRLDANDLWQQAWAPKEQPTPAGTDTGPDNGGRTGRSVAVTIALDEETLEALAQLSTANGHTLDETITTAAALHLSRARSSAAAERDCAQPVQETRSR